MTLNTEPPRKDNRIRLDPDVDRSLDYYISEQMVDLKDVPGVRAERNTVVSDWAKEALKKLGHYPPNKDVPVEGEQDGA